MRRKALFSGLLTLLLAMNLCACSDPDPTPTSPTEATPAPTDPVAVDYSDIYKACRENVQAQKNLSLSYSYRLQRVVDGQEYVQTATGTAAYDNYGTAKMEALICEDLAFGNYECEYYLSYLSGRGYCRVNNCNFVCTMAAPQFIAQQLPSVLLNENCYEDVTAIPSAGEVTVSFRNATAPENWIANSAITLISAQGTAVLGSDQEIMSTSYRAEFSISDVIYSLEVTVRIEDAAPDLSGHPVYPAKCVTVTDLRIPRYLLQTAGDLFATECFTANYTDTLYSEALAVLRTQSCAVNIMGSGENLLATIDNRVSVTDYTGVTETNTHVITFQDQQYSYVTNGGKPIKVDKTTAEDMRISCEDTVLNALFSLDSIQAATLYEEGDFLYIELLGNDAYSNGICANAYSVLGLNLDQYSDSYQTTATGGYLAINRKTGLATALGQFVDRTHYIDGVGYRMSYQLDQSLQLPSTTAEQTLTGNCPEEIPPEIGATPLLYEITGENGQIMYLFGTIPVGDNRTGFMPEYVETAFSNADALAVEVDSEAFTQQLQADTTLQAAISQAYYYADGSDAFSHLQPEDAQALQRWLRITGSNNINAPYRKVTICNSLLEEFFLQQGSDLSSQKGADVRLLKWAKELEKPIYEIETGLEQIQMLTGFSDELQQYLFRELRQKNMTGYCQDTQMLYELWCSGDEAALTQHLTTDTTFMTEEELNLWKQYNKAMLTDRNQKMLQAAKTYLESDETVFFAVGIAHILGEDGLLQLLQQSGYQIQCLSH